MKEWFAKHIVEIVSIVMIVIIFIIGFLLGYYAGCNPEEWWSATNCTGI